MSPIDFRGYTEFKLYEPPPDFLYKELKQEIRDFKAKLNSLTANLRQLEKDLPDMLLIDIIKRLAQIKLDALNLIHEYFEDHQH